MSRHRLGISGLGLNRERTGCEESTRVWVKNHLGICLAWLWTNRDIFLSPTHDGKLMCSSTGTGTDSQNSFYPVDTNTCVRCWATTFTRQGVDLIQCLNCGKWFHETCTTINHNMFINCGRENMREKNVKSRKLVVATSLLQSFS